MNRRHFLGATAGVTACLLGSETASFLRRNVGIGVVRAASVDAVPPQATVARGRVSDVDGSAVTLEIVAKDALQATELIVARRQYPEGDVVAEVRSDPVKLPNPGTSTTVDVDVPFEGYESGRWFYEVYVDESGGELAYLCESAPYRWEQRPEYGARRASRVTDGPDPTDRHEFGRRLDDNEYRLRYRWRDGSDRSWRVCYRLRRSVHEAAVARERGYATTFEESQSSRYARDLAATITSDAVVGSQDADGDGSAGSLSDATDLSDGEWFDLLVRFVQGIDYTRDAASIGQYDYNRTIEETLVAGVGDCKDKTHLLAGLLGASPLSCRTAMLFQPAHVLLGVAVDDVPERFDDRATVELCDHEYLPIDASLRFAIGDYPDAPITAAYGADGWFHHDLGAIGRGLDRNVRDFIEQNVSA